MSELSVLIYLWSVFNIQFFEFVNVSEDFIFSSNVILNIVLLRILRIIYEYCFIIISISISNSSSKYLFIIVTCIYNIDINIMVMNNRICKANLAYKVTFW